MRYEAPVELPEAEVRGRLERPRTGIFIRALLSSAYFSTISDLDSNIRLALMNLTSYEDYWAVSEALILSLQMRKFIPSVLPEAVHQLEKIAGLEENLSEIYEGKQIRLDQQSG